MEIAHRDFIGFYNKIYEDYFCQHVIDEFERVLTKGHCGTRQNSEGVTKTNKEDLFYFLNFKNHVFSDFNGKSVNDLFFAGLQKCFDAYSNEYDILKSHTITCSSVKIQKTNPGAGYHVWHCEQGNGSNSSRCLTYIIYLNTLEDDAAGETELLYQRTRIKAEENSCIIFPAAFTHAHRGNVVHGNKPKYIITGWFYLE